MERKALVTVGTDGLVDYVQTPDGQKHILGTVSVLRLVTGLVNPRMARKALQEFIETNQTMISVDLDKMWSLLPFRRARYSSIGLGGYRGNNMKVASYETFNSNLETAEEIIEKLAETDETIDRLKAAGKNFNSIRAKMDLHKIAARVAAIAQDVDLAQPWVSADLGVLHRKASEIHELFPHNKKLAKITERRFLIKRVTKSGQIDKSRTTKQDWQMLSFDDESKAEKKLKDLEKMNPGITYKILDMEDPKNRVYK